jgi:3-oxoacyl-[acyl-carrier-protein] synthase II
MDPNGDEIVRCLEIALQKSGRHPEEIGYVNYHGTSTQLNDAIESRCVRRFFGSHADSVPGSSTKSMIGHPQGAWSRRRCGDRARHDARPAAADDQSGQRRPACDMDFIPTTRGRRTFDAALCKLSRLRIKEQRTVLGSVR